MIVRTAFDLDCNPVIPECKFACPKCMKEIEATLTSKDGVSKVYRGEGAEEGEVFVEHDPTVATVDQLIEALQMLPSFYDGFFVATAVRS